MSGSEAKILNPLQQQRKNRLKESEFLRQMNEKFDALRKKTKRQKGISLSASFVKFLCDKCHILYVVPKSMSEKNRFERKCDKCSKDTKKVVVWNLAVGSRKKRK